MRTDSLAGSLHVWRVDLDQPPSEVARLREDLTAGELVRMERLRSDALRRRFAVAHAALRRLLGAYLGVQPADVAIAAPPGAKPRIDGAPEPLRFNMAHSGDIALVAVTAEREVGVDVEQLRTLPRLDGMARKVLSERERAVLAAVDVGDRDHAFLTAWTCKEAVLKALGDGLARDPAGVELAAPAGAPPRLLALAGDGGAAARWVLQTVDAGPGYVAAVAYAGAELRVDVRSWAAAATAPAIASR